MKTSTTGKPLVKRLPLLALFGANIISMVGSVLTLIAIPWFVLVTTQSAAKTGLTAFCEALAIVVAGIFGGTIVDRMGYKRTSIVADMTSGVAVALVPLLYYTVGLAFWQLLVLVFLSALFDSPGGSARTALLPDVAKLAEMSLEQANASLQAIQRGSRLLGAPLAGILIAILGPSRLLWLDAATFGVSALVVTLAIPQLVIKSKSESARHYLKELKEGVQFIRRDRLLFALVLITMVTNFLDAPFFSVILPVYVKERFGSALDFGLAFATFGGGSLVGAIIFSIIAPKLPRRATFIGGFIVAGLLFWVLALLPTLPVILSVLLISGVASGPINPIIDTINQEHAPIGMRGRVIGTAMAGAYLALPLGTVLAGYLLEGIGIRTLLFVLAICYLIVTVSLLFNPALHDMDNHESGKQGLT